MPNVTASSSEASISDVQKSCFTVHVGDLVLGLPVGDTQTIFKISEVTPIPLGPAHVAGLANLRGRVMTVVDLGTKFGRNAGRQVLPGSLAIGLHVDGEDYALVVDKVGEVIEVDSSKRAPLPPHLNPDHERMMLGLYKVGDLLLPVLNVKELLGPKSNTSVKRGGSMPAGQAASLSSAQ